MNTRRRLVLLVTMFAGIGLTIAPNGTARATGDGGTTDVVAVFDGNASISPGMCIPGDAPGCVGPALAGYNLTIHGDPAPLPAVCQAAGVFEGAAMSGACALIANGVLDGVVTDKPSCGSAIGESSGANTLTLPTVSRNHSHTLVVTGGAIWANLNPGQTFVMVGYVDDADADTDATDDDHRFIALVHAIPVSATGTITCLTTPAEVFIVAGVAEVA